MKRNIINILFIFFAFRVLAISPEILCLQVHDDGSVTIQWESFNTSADKYEIFYQPHPDSIWRIVGTQISNNQFVEFNHVLSNANDRYRSYFITAVFPTYTDTSTVCRTMHLNADNTQPEKAYLTWNNISGTNPPGSEQNYNIYMSIYRNGIAGNWKLLGSEQNPHYNYDVENGLCDDSLNFKIELKNTISNCTSVSNISGNWFSEDIHPTKPIFDSVSVISNNDVILGWTASASVDAAGTIYYNNSTGVNLPIDTIFPNTTTFFIDTKNSPCNNPYGYAISAIDSCGKSSPSTEPYILKPIVINNIESDLCSSTISVNWEPYINPVVPIDKYRVWAVVNSKDTIIAGEVDGNTTSFIHDNVLQNTQYTYFIRAYFGNYTSTSCSKSITTFSYILPQNLYFANSTVLEDNSIDLSLDIDLNPINCTWEIYRSDTNSSNLELLKTYTRDQVSSSLLEYNDIEANGSDGYYFYNAIVYDSCGNESIISNLIKTMYLSGELPAENIIKLTWNEFEGWDAGVKRYYIYRMSDNIIPQNPIDSIDSQTTDYTDDISNVDLSTTEFTYWITAVENVGNIYGYCEKSNSNRVKFVRETELYMPNAFKPDGTNNRVFAPVVAGYVGSDFLMQIFSRWGQMIFESYSPYTGWDGTTGGNPCPAGTYVYNLSYKNSKYETKKYKGTVMLLR